MFSARKLLIAGLAAATFSSLMMSATPAAAWGRGWGGGWGYGGAALTGLAVGAVAAGALQNQYGYGHQYYGYARPYRRARLCVANQALYDDWGDFIGYRRVRVPC